MVEVTFEKSKLGDNPNLLEVAKFLDTARRKKIESNLRSSLASLKCDMHEKYCSKVYVYNQRNIAPFFNYEITICC